MGITNTALHQGPAITLRPRIAGMLLCATTLAGCGEGGGGGTVSTPAPTAAVTTPAVTATPTPTVTTTTTTAPASTFQTAEYDRSTGPSFHNAIPAWQTGATGSGVTIGVVDSGIDSASPEFTGRISAASADVVGSRGIANADSDHGTDVALIAAAARDNVGIMGVAYGATLLVARADTPGSCAAASGCSFDDTAIAAGINRAVASGAKVVNVSLGGSAPSAVVTQAVAAAAAAGAVVVVSAGNDGKADPDAFATGLAAAGNGNVIIAGSVGATGAISAFSNKAGGAGNSFLAALGEQVCCAYANGALKVTTGTDGKQYITVVSGTSFSAPQIAGAAALLMQAFPRLTAVQVVNLLLTTARAGGSAQGSTSTTVDATYGHGILDIAAAFAPQGTTKVAGASTTVLALGDTSAAVSPAMGDAAQHANLAMVVLDSYGRAFHINLASTARGAQLTPKLTNALTSPAQQVALGTNRLSLAFSLDSRGAYAVLPWSGQLRLSQADAPQKRVMAARLTAELSPRASLAFALREGSDGVVASLQGQDQPAFLVAGDPSGDVGFQRSGQAAVALRRVVGGWGLTVSAESGAAVTAAPWRQLGDPVARDALGSTLRYGAAIDRHFGRLETALSASWLAETHTVLGARFHEALGARGADSLFLDARLGWQVGDGWHFSAAWRQGLTAVRSGGLVQGGSHLASNAWSVDTGRGGVLLPGDRLQLRVSQPLRVAAGGLNFNLPVDYSYATDTATYGLRTLSLAPAGREVTGEIAWHAPLWRGLASTSLFYRRNPGNYASLPDDHGVALGWKGAF